MDKQFHCISGEPKEAAAACNKFEKENTFLEKYINMQSIPQPNPKFEQGIIGNNQPPFIMLQMLHCVYIYESKILK